VYNEKQTKEMLHFNYHTDSVRQVVFSPDGNILYTSSSDGSIGVISMGKLEGRLAGAHPVPINSLMHIENNAILASGDDDGLLKIWDLRLSANGKQGCVMQFNEHEGTIMDMKMNDQNNMLLTSANDGHLGVFDLRMNKLYAMSDNFEEDLTALVICKYQKKVLVSSGEGIINIFSWDWFGDCKDRIVGHPNSIDTMIKYDEDTVITGGEDGLIRAVSVLPNKIIAILSDPTEQDEGEIFHIQRVALSHDKCLLASISLDDIVKIIDVSQLGTRLKEDFDEEAYEHDLQENPKIKRKKNRVAVQGGDAMMDDDGEEKKGDDGEWEDDDSSDDYGSDSSSDDDDDDMKKKRVGKKDKKLNVKGNTVSKSKKMVEMAKK
jgi:WD repeat-containing protein 55